MSSKNNQGKPEKKKRKGRTDGLPVVPRNFIDLIAIVVAVLQEYGARPDGLSVADMQKIEQDETAEKKADEVLYGQYKAAHKKYRLAQATRLKAVEQTTNDLRSKYANNPVVLERLKKVKFRTKGRHEEPKAPENGGENPGGPAPENPKPEGPK